MEVAMAEPTIGSPLSLHDPRSVGPWAIHARLGAGGMGVVYLATQGDQTAAVKVIRPGLLDAPATRDRFRREVAILAAVRDVHICHYLDADLEAEPAWLALEYLPGPVLRDQVAAEGPLPEAQWWTLARGLAQALAVLELHRVTHRDLKPGNVILHERGPVLIDFGIAHPEDATSLTATGLVTGSPAWLSPEQANLEPTGPATDVFTLGSLLAFAATGRPPFGEGASVAVLMSIIKRDPDLAGIDPVRTALLERMLRKDPAGRPTARDVLELARAGEAGEDVAALLGLPTDATVPAGPAPVDPTIVDATVADAPPPALPLVAGSAAAAPGGRAAAAPPPPADALGPELAGDAAGGTTRPDGMPGVPATGVGVGSPPGPLPTPAAQPAVQPQPTPPAQPPPAPAVQAPAPRRGRTWLFGLLAVVAIALVAWLVLPSLMGGGADGDGGEPDASTSAPVDGGEAPPAPASDQLVSGDWLLESYRLDNTGEGLVVSGTVRNRGDAASSADLRVWVYLDGASLGSASTTVTDVPAGAAVPVAMRGDAVWQPGQKVVLLQAQ
jgi:hypothetical protein